MNKIYQLKEINNAFTYMLSDNKDFYNFLWHMHSKIIPKLNNHYNLTILDSQLYFDDIQIYEGYIILLVKSNTINKVIHIQVIDHVLY